MRLVLASASPRRRELMKLIADDFEVRPSDADEAVPENIPAEKTAGYLSAVKAGAVMHNPGEIIIGCDTVVVIDDRVLGKPADEGECRKMLEALSGRIHNVYTGVTLLGDSRSHTFTAVTRVEFYKLSEKDITDYIAAGESLDKAGAYGIQGRGALLVKKIEGDYFNVVGLPVAELNRELKKFLNQTE